MKNKRNSQRDDYRLLKNKLLIRTFGMLFFAFAFLAALYSLFLRGHIANAFVGFLDNFVYHDYDRALNVYSMSNIKIGSIATLIGKDENDEIAAPTVAENSESITNELLSRMGRRLNIIYKM